MRMLGLFGNTRVVAESTRQGKAFMAKEIQVKHWFNLPKPMVDRLWATSNYRTHQWCGGQCERCLAVACSASADYACGDDVERHVVVQFSDDSVASLSEAQTRALENFFLTVFDD